ncbi:MAG TPA: site-2 protease family protein [Candidatus Acidoferrales bacterium]|nr:site-2 protease family protein [Candidatus Acidoferrales bacterium]
MQSDVITLGVLWYIAFLFSTVCHEGSHALVAKWGGDLTAFHGGQVSLNPVPHIRREPFGLVLVPILSYALGGWMIGWASAPYNPEWRRRYPRRAAYMALAGPAANFILMLLAALAIRVGISTGRFQAPASVKFSHVVELAGGGTNFATTILSIFFALNLLLGTFNLLPVPPLDGNTGITIFMSDEAAIRFVDWTRSGFGFLGLFIAWYAFDKLFDPVWLFSLRALYPGAGYH